MGWYEKMKKEAARKRKAHLNKYRPSAIRKSKATALIHRIYKMGYHFAYNINVSEDGKFVKIYGKVSFLNSFKKETGFKGEIKNRYLSEDIEFRRKYYSGTLFIKVK